jgi:hypothetical protein
MMKALTVKERGAHVATFRHIEVRLMEILSRWVPTTPEMEAKLLFGPHIWDAAQAADALGKRANELRLPLHHSQTPADEYVGILDAVAEADGAARRIAACYDVLLPGLSVRLGAYVARTDPLMDAPTVRIVETILATHQRMIRDADELRESLPALRAGDREWARALSMREAAVLTLVADPPPGARRAA